MIESELVAQLKLLCANVYPDEAPAGVARPYVIWQGLGGPAMRYVDNAAAAQRRIHVQISVWHSTRAGALDLVQQIEAQLCSPEAPFSASPLGEAQALREPGLDLYGSQQDFDILGAR